MAPLFGRATASATSLLFVRHGVTEMNEYLTKVPYLSPGFVDPPLYDTRLSQTGVRQASEALRDQLRREHLRRPIELVICSPLSRALMTADLGLGDIQVPCLVDPDLAERHYLSSDVGRSPKELASEFPRFASALEALPESWWWQADAAAEREAHTARLALQGGREPLRGVALPVEPQAVFTSRLELFKSQLLARPERSVAVVAHWAVFYSLLGKSLHNCEIVVCKDTDLLPDLVSPPG